MKREKVEVGLRINPTNYLKVRELAKVYGFKIGDFVDMLFLYILDKFSKNELTINDLLKVKEGRENEKL